MFVIGYGISMDVEDLPSPVLDRDQTTLSRDYALQLSGSRYFVERPALTDYDELDRRMQTASCRWPSRSRRASPRRAARPRGADRRLGRWRHADRAETVRGYVTGHAPELAAATGEALGVRAAGAAQLETRFTATTRM